ncbi:DUF4845 domain-containing protein [Parvibium lacunae]|uniref:DUF4845 domain-containing protein n=1 Tax=Parvibium lacunae TaxID=1888893 RepID=A0A368L7F7_9BURK|nr:DUF4845 domain-containing protein [Parvibium lacunae]RCS59547.1 DUF4845 domain-containing protein [Parvibium lacunae]
MHTRSSIQQQRGFSFLKLIIICALLIFGSVFVMKLFPVLNEYWTLQRAIKATRDLNHKTPSAVRDSLGKFLYINEIRTFDPAKDFVVEQTKSGDGYEISFAYSREIKLMEWNNARLVFDFTGTTDTAAEAKKLIEKLK